MEDLRWNHASGFKEEIKGKLPRATLGANPWNDYESDHRLDFSFHLLKWTEPFFSPQSALLHIEALNVMRIFFSLNDNLVPIHMELFGESKI